MENWYCIWAEAAQSSFSVLTVFKIILRGLVKNWLYCNHFPTDEFPTDATRQVFLLLYRLFQSKCFDDFNALESETFTGKTMLAISPWLIHDNSLCICFVWIRFLFESFLLRIISLWNNVLCGCLPLHTFFTSSSLRSVAIHLPYQRNISSSPPHHPYVYIYTTICSHLHLVGFNSCISKT